MNTVWKILLPVLLATTALLGSQSVQAQQSVTVAEDGQHKINIAGRQRMLSQLIAKSACFTRLGVRPDHHTKKMREAQTTFDKTLEILTAGSEQLRIRSEKNPEVLKALDNVASLWLAYNHAITSFADNYKEGDVQSSLETIYKLSKPVLRESDAVVHLLEAKYRDSEEVRPGLAGAINVAGRQRMLSQKMSKEFCKVAVGFKPDETRKHLLGTVALFGSSHEGIVDGLEDLNLSSAERDKILTQLKKIEQLWQPLNKVFFAVATGAAPTSEEVELIAESNEVFLAELNKAVEMYEYIDLEKVH